MTPHGSSSTYRNYGCRCAECTEAWRVYHMEYRHRRGRNLPRDVWLQKVAAEAADHHGTEGSYKRCKCESCRRAARVGRQERRLRAKARAA